MKKTYLINGEETVLENLVLEAGSVRFSLEGKDYHFSSGAAPDGEMTLSTLGRQLRGVVGKRGKDGARAVFIGGLEAQVGTPHTGRKGASGGGAASNHAAPMPGKVLEVLVSKGDAVVAGQTLLVMEAMKLQLNIDAAYAGVVETVCFKAGDLVSDGDELVKLEAQVNAA